MASIVYDGTGNIIERDGVAIGSRVALKRKDAIYVMRAHLEKRLRNSDFIFIEGTCSSVEYYDNGIRKVLSISSRKSLPKTLTQEKSNKMQMLLAADFADKIKFLGFAGKGAYYQNGDKYYEIH